VIQFADFTGDSLKLSQLASAQKNARYIVFCGVHFMAESADVLSAEHQAVLLPNLRAGCAMAEMADEPAVAEAFEEIARLSDEPIVPVTYVNSTAAIKALTARHGGACCTSSNVENVFRWALRPKREGGAGGRKIFAVPDEHLARNTAAAMGYDVQQACAVYDPSLPSGGLTAEDVRRARFLLWRGHCYVHQVFRVEHVRAAREQMPHATVIVHPECPREVVREADAAGSTSQIIRAVETGEAGTQWVIGTEGNLVRRLGRLHPDKTVRLLSDAPALCSQMAQIDLPHLCWTLESLAAGELVNPVRVAPAVAADARRALERMVAIPRAEDVHRNN
jgi:quinolinate synthase